MMDRYWVNQPSTLQVDHKLHGSNVLCDMSEKTLAKANKQHYVIVYSTDCNVTWTSREMSTLSLSRGWLTKEKQMNKLVKDTPEFDAAVKEFSEHAKEYVDKIDELYDSLTIICEQFWCKLEDPEVDFLNWPYVNGRTFGSGKYQSDPYWVSSSENC